jgi:ABC-type hemin transport system ATPase subunit
MASELAGRLSTARHRAFVGRVAERDLFRSAITADEPLFNVLYVFGPGGVGKATLLREFAHLCTEGGVPANYVDARNLDPSPDSFMSTLWATLGLDAQYSPFQAGTG